VNRHRTPWAATQMWWNCGELSERRKEKWILSDRTAWSETGSLQDLAYLSSITKCRDRPSVLDRSKAAILASQDRSYAGSWIETTENVPSTSLGE
jgi:hypothetical protein